MANLPLTTRGLSQEELSIEEFLYKMLALCEYLRHCLSPALETVSEIWDNSARISGFDTISCLPQSINIALGALAPRTTLRREM